MSPAPGDPYEPVVTALLAAARAEGAASLARAREEAGRAHAAARGQVAALLAAARAEGNADADRLLAVEGRTSRREAHELVLAARSTALQDLRRRCRSAAAELPRRADYPELLEGLARSAREVLGERAVLESDGEGGVVARSGSRRLDLRLSTLADRALDALGTELESLWR